MNFSQFKESLSSSEAFLYGLAHALISSVEHLANNTFPSEANSFDPKSLFSHILSQSLAKDLDEITNQVEDFFDHHETGQSK